MKIATAAYISCGDHLHPHNEPPTPYWTDCLLNPAWWIRRTEILTRFVLPSLARQSFRSFDRWACFAEESREAAKPFVNALTAAGFRLIWERKESCPASPRRQRPHPEATSFYRGRADGIVWVWQETDDPWDRTAYKVMSQMPKKPGIVTLCRRGHVVDLESGEVWIYASSRSPPPFFARFYDRDGIRDPIAYEAAHRYDTSHHQLGLCRTTPLPDFLFCSLIHGSNTRLTIAKMLELGFLRRILGPKEASEVKRRYGIMEDHK